MRSALSSARMYGAACLAFVLSVAWPASQAQAQTFDLLIRGGMVLDGSGNPAVRADVGVRDGRIAAVGDLADASGERVVEARGLHVVPGFIDIHSHADRALYDGDARQRQARNLVAQGITTIVVGPDGRNPTWPLSDEIAGYRQGGTAVNVVPMVGHGTVRGLVMGDDYERHATPDEIARMQTLVRQGMEEGAWGMGAGPEYRPGRFSTTEELVALARVVADYDGFYYAHQRSQSPLPLWLTPSIVEDYVPPPTWPPGWRLTATDGMAETIRIGREAGIRVVGTHIKAKGPTTWGQSAVDVMAIDRARAEGVEVYLDQYPYETFGGGSVEVIPRWYYAPPGTDRNGGLDDPMWGRDGLMADREANLRAHLEHPVYGPELVADVEYILDLQGGADRHVIVVSPYRPSLVGRTLA
ncbi:MAG: amidohydrolase family protein, partial [Longimicrobiales bacterium]|nr:amidohydrolase family protein [Longimicrobiales bacterium]